MANEKRLIDANALEEFLAEERQKKSIACCDYYDGYGDAIDNVDDWIDAQPTVDAVEVVHGKWLYDSGTERHFCSACNEYAISVITNTPVYEYDWEENLQLSHIEADCDEQLTNFCPNCGAKMDGGNEDDRTGI